MRKRLTSLGHGLLVVAAVSGASCQGEEEETVPLTEDEIALGVNLEALGENLGGCTAADTTAAITDPNFVNIGSKTLGITVATGKDAVISVVGGKLKINGHQCKTAAVVGPPAVASVDLTSTNVNRINITASGTSKIVVDLLPGTFGNIFTATAGGIQITGGAGLSVGVRGTAAANAFKMAHESTGLAAGPFYAELSGDTKADLKIVGNPDAISFALGDGADSFTAQGQVLTGLGVSGTTIDVTGEPITVFGGIGVDTLKGGLGNDTLNGGDGNDIFQTSGTNVDDGDDTYIGGAGTDLVDYGNRTTNLNVSVAPTHTNARIEGVNLTSLSVAAGTLSCTVGGVADNTVFPAGPTVGTAAILAAIDGAMSLATPSVNDRGELVIEAIAGASAVSCAATGAGATLFVTAKSNNGVSQLGVDADDGQASEFDDVRADVENITGGTGNDTLTGGIGHDTINGGLGNDNLSGGPGGSPCSGDVDVLNGGDGDDLFAMGNAANCGDNVDGGAGKDTVNYELRGNGLLLDIDAAADDGETGEADTLKVGIEVLISGSGNDTITGGANDDEIHGGAGTDQIAGGAGADTIVGGPGADTLNGNAGEDVFIEKDIADTAFATTVLFSDATEDDIINGGADSDTADYGRTDTTGFVASLCVSTTLTGAGVCTNPNDAANNDPDGDDITNVETFKGGAGPDSINGSSGDDIIEGGAGNDTILGGAGNDYLSGDADDDRLEGEAGDDSLDGLTGTNTLIGGDGDGDMCTVGAGGTTATCEI